MRNISEWSIRNPIPTIVLFLSLTLVGLSGFTALGIDLDPNTDVPQVSVTITQTGAAPVELETQVTRKVEEAVAGIGNIRHITSTVSDGASQTNIEFVLGTNIDRAVNDVRDAIAKIRQQLPQSIDEPTIQRDDNTSEPFISFTLSSNRRSPVELSTIADLQVARALSTVSGVSRVYQFGSKREIGIHLDPLRLQALGITADQVNTQIKTLNIDLPGGRGAVGTSEQAIRTLGSAASVENLRRLRIALPTGGFAPLSSLGRITDGTAEQRWIAFFDGKPAVVLQIVRTSGSNLVAVEDAIHAKVHELEKTLPPDIKITLLWTNGDFIRESYNASVESVLLGAGLAIVVIWLFLRDWRSTLIAALAIPLSAIPTFAAMHALGFTLNNMSLLALALVIGILVDDAIVELENITRHIAMGKTPFQAAIDAADEIGLAVVATTMSIVAVFLPVGFMQGIQGQYFRQFGLTVAVAVLFSLAVARMLTPLMAAYLLKANDKPHKKGNYFYDRILNWALNHRLITILSAVGFFAGSLALIPMLPTSFLGKVDSGQSLIRVDLPPGSSMATTRKAIEQLSAIVKADPNVASIFGRVGSVGSGFGSVNSGRLLMNLKPRSERKLSQQEFEAQIRPKLNQVPGVRILFGGGWSTAMRLVLTGDNPELLNRTARDLADQMRSTEKVFVDVSSSAALLRPEIQVRPHLSRAAEQGVSVDAIARTALIATLGDSEARLARFNLPGRQINIRIQLDPNFRTNIDTIRNLQVTGNEDRLIPLQAVADVRMSSGAVEISRYDRARQVTVSSNLASGVELGTALKVVHQLPALRRLPAGISEKLSGDAENQADVFNGFGFAIVAAILLIYAVLVLLFGGFFHPLTIMVSLPLSLGGALIGLLLFGKSLGLYTLIGIIMLMGLVTKNAILLVEYALVAMKAGEPRQQAILGAGEARMRPILMTTIAMIAGMVPIALGWGAGAEARSPMAVAVVGGLLTSTALTLVVIPVVFTCFDDLQKQISKLFRTTPKDTAALPAQE